jgi:enamine deaminase RidA (YjgF/YER057c/UK114 family)
MQLSGQITLVYHIDFRQQVPLIQSQTEQAFRTRAMRMGNKTLATACAVMLLCSPLLSKKKNPDDITQTLELPKDPPSVVTADLHRAVFRVSPLLAKGLLSAQTHDAVKALLKSTSGETIVRIRAFVAGSGDLRRVPQIVSEVFTDRKLPLPAVSVVQAGGLPLTGAQVLLESISTAKKNETAPAGVLFVPAQLAQSPELNDNVAPLATRALDQFNAAVVKGGGSSVLRITCYVSSLADAAAIHAMIAAKYPQAAVALVQPRREHASSAVSCEGIAKLAMPVDGVVFVKDGGNVVGAAVSARTVALSGTLVAYGYEDRNARLAFDRMNKVLEPAKASWKSVVEVRFYPLAASIVKQIERVRGDFLDRANPPAISMAPIEGLPSIDASFAMDAIAVVQ